jgi:hypothetical protein
LAAPGAGISKRDRHSKGEKPLNGSGDRTRTGDRLDLKLVGLSLELAGLLVVSGRRIAGVRGTVIELIGLRRVFIGELLLSASLLGVLVGGPATGLRFGFDLTYAGSLRVCFLTVLGSLRHQLLALSLPLDLTLTNAHRDKCDYEHRGQN